MKTYEKPQMNFLTVEQDVVTMSLPIIKPKNDEMGEIFIPGATTPKWE